MASRLLSSALNKAVGPRGARGTEEKMDVDGYTPVTNNKNNRRNGGAPNQSRGNRTHNNNSTPYGRPPRPGSDAPRGPASGGRNPRGGISIRGGASDPVQQGSSRLAQRLGGFAAAGPSSHNGRSNTNTERAHNARVKQSQTIAGAVAPRKPEVALTVEQEASGKAFKASLDDGSFKNWLSGRYQVEGGILDLSALASDPWFAQQGIIPFTEPTAWRGAGTSFFVAVNNVAQREESMPIKIINFANNGLTSLEQLSRCSWYLRQVERISLANNPIPTYNSLRALLRVKPNKGGQTGRGAYRKLIELDLSGVPFVADLLKDGDEAYRKAITDLFPQLQILDTVSLAELDAKKSSPAAPVPAVLPAAPTAPIVPIAPAPVAAPPAPQGESDLDKFARLSGMTMEWTLKCVQENGGDFDKAWVNFEACKHQIPPEAFAKA